MAASFRWFEFRLKAQFPTVIRRTSALSFRSTPLKIGLNEDYVPGYLYLKPFHRSLCQISTKVSYCACFSLSKSSISSVVYSGFRQPIPLIFGFLIPCLMAFKYPRLRRDIFRRRRAIAFFLYVEFRSKSTISNRY